MKLLPSCFCRITDIMISLGFSGGLIEDVNIKDGLQ